MIYSPSRYIKQFSIVCGTVVAVGSASALTISTSHSSGTYDYEADSQIITSGIVILNGSANVTYRASGKVILKPGFTASNGSKFVAGIDKDFDGYTDFDSDGDTIPDSFERSIKGVSLGLNPFDAADGLINDVNYKIPIYEVYHLNLYHTTSKGSNNSAAPGAMDLFHDLDEQNGVLQTEFMSDVNGDGISDYNRIFSTPEINCRWNSANFYTMPTLNYQIFSNGAAVSGIVQGIGGFLNFSWYDCHLSYATWQTSILGRASEPWSGGEYRILGEVDSYAIPTVVEPLYLASDEVGFKINATNTSSGNVYIVEALIDGIWKVLEAAVGTGGNISFTVSIP